MPVGTHVSAMCGQRRAIAGRTMTERGEIGGVSVCRRVYSV